jgi:hypothetical protein
VRPVTPVESSSWYSVVMDEPTHEGNHWVDSYIASYRYRYTSALLIFPIFGLLAILLVRRSDAAIAVAIGAELLFILVFLQYRSYCVQLGAGSIRTVSILRNKSFALSDVDLIQHLYGDRGGQLLRIRHSDRILLTVSRDLDGFDDLVGFFREYAKHHHIIFATRDDFGEWTQSSGPLGSDQTT